MTLERIDARTRRARGERTTAAIIAPVRAEDDDLGDDYYVTHATNFAASLDLDAADLANPALVIDLAIEGLTKAGWQQFAAVEGWHGGIADKNGDPIAPRLSWFAQDNRAVQEVRLRYRLSRAANVGASLDAQPRDILTTRHHSIGDRAVAGSAGTGTSLTYSHTVAGTSEKALWVGVTSYRSSARSDPTGITYAAAALTKLANFLGGGGNDNVCSLWRRIAPSSGANNVVVTHSVSHDITAASISYSGVDQTTPNDAVSSLDSTSTTPSHSVSSATGDVVVSFAMGWSWAAAAAGGGLTLRYEDDNNNGLNSIAIGDASGAGSVTCSWSFGGFYDDPHGLFSFNINQHVSSGVSVDPAAAAIATPATTATKAVSKTPSATAISTPAATVAPARAVTGAVEGIATPDAETAKSAAIDGAAEAIATTDAAVTRAIAIDADADAVAEPAASVAPERAVAPSIETIASTAAAITTARSSAGAVESIAETATEVSQEQLAAVDGAAEAIAATAATVVTARSVASDAEAIATPATEVEATTAGSVSGATEAIAETDATVTPARSVAGAAEAIAETAVAVSSARGVDADAPAVAETDTAVSVLEEYEASGAAEAIVEIAVTVTVSRSVSATADAIATTSAESEAARLAAVALIVPVVAAATFSTARSTTGAAVAIVTTYTLPGALNVPVGITLADRSPTVSLTDSCPTITLADVSPGMELNDGSS